jgi:formate dehydrogenase iron-sulfur subunit
MTSLSPAGRSAGQPEPSATRTLIDDLIGEQRRLTAVEEFSRAHDRHEIGSPRYRNLMPVSPPGAGQQYAFEVDLDQCSGCKACVTACHSLNGLDDGESWREVGQLVSDDWRQPFQAVVTTACHHCVDPGCLNGCPVLAYEKDPVTGIVRHLDDQCIGCSYCILKCPYEVPKYSSERGIVRKCDMCSQRLAVGEAPACVQACPNEAIRITLVEQESLQRAFRAAEAEGSNCAEAPERNAEVVAETNRLAPTILAPRLVPNFLPASPEPGITLPSTRYVSKRTIPLTLLPAGHAEPRLQPAHWPLVWMLVLTQLGVGAFALLPATAPDARPLLAVLAMLATLLGLGSSVAHLGRPLKAWRSFLGLRTSWLSREIVVFGAFAPLAITTGVLALNGGAPGFLLWSAPVVGILGVVCSAMIYHDTRRPCWRGMRSLGNFLGTSAVLGFAAAWLAAPHSVWWSGGLILAATVKFAGEHRMLRRAGDDIADDLFPKSGEVERWSLARSARLLRDRLALLTRLRFFAAFFGGVILPLVALLVPEAAQPMAASSFAFSFFAEVAARYGFFRAEVSPRMPGLS